MWIVKQDTGNDMAAFNTDLCNEIWVDILGNVGRIYMSNGDQKVLLGEYRDYAAKMIFKNLCMSLSSNTTTYMPDEQEANENFKHMEGQ